MTGIKKNRVFVFLVVLMMMFSCSLSFVFAVDEPADDGADDDTYVAPATLTFGDIPSSIPVGGQINIPYEISGGDGNSTTIEWYSSNKDVATVDNKGTVTAISQGTVEITASINGVRNASALIKVEPIKIKGVTIKVKEFSTADTLQDLHELNVGDTLHLTASIEPEEVQDANLVWESSDESVIKIDEQGVLTAVAPGEALITAKVGDVSAELAFKVVKAGMPLKTKLLIGGGILIFLIAAFLVIFFLLRSKRRAEELRREELEQKRELAKLKKKQQQDEEELSIYEKQNKEYGDNTITSVSKKTQIYKFDADENKLQDDDDGEENNEPDRPFDLSDIE
jgi:flagellar basal body-associated protein FliL